MTYGIRLAVDKALREVIRAAEKKTKVSEPDFSGLLDELDAEVARVTELQGHKHVWEVAPGWETVEGKKDEICTVCGAHSRYVKTK